MGALAYIMRRRSEQKVKEFESMLASPQETQEGVLEEILKMNQDTIFGKDHCFDSISDVSKFQDMVPLRTYDQYHREYISRLMDRPTESILSSSRLIHWFITSGGGKYIPFTEVAYKRNKENAQNIIMYFVHEDPKEHSKIFDGKLLAWAAPPVVSTLNGIPVGYKSGFAMSRGNWFTNRLMAVPEKVQSMGDWEKKYDAVFSHVINKRITSIGGLTSILAVLLEKTAETHKEPSELWPDMQVFMTGGVDVDHYRSTFKRFFPDAHIRDNFGASEMDFAFEMEDSGGLVPIYNSGFLEGIPVDLVEKEKNGGSDFIGSDAKPLTSVKRGDVVELVFTGLNGLYRYRMGDLVKCIAEEPLRFRFFGRIEDEINMSGEKFKVSYLEKVIHSAAQEESSRVRWFVPAGFDLQYHFVVCFDEEPDEASITRFLQSVEERLSSSGEYSLLRSGDVLKPPEIKIVQFGEVDRLVASSGTHPDQFKFRPIGKEAYEGLRGDEYLLR